LFSSEFDAAIGSGVVTSLDSGRDSDGARIKIDGGSGFRQPLQFVVVCLVLTWVPWAFLGMLGLNVDAGAAKLVFGLAASGPSLAALVMWFISRRDQQRPPMAVRASWVWPFVSILVGVAPPVLAALCAHVTDQATIPRHAASVAVSVGGPLGVLAYTMISGPLSEEFGWRGYLQPRLRRHFGRIHTSIVLGAGWGLWHVPLFLLDGTGQHERGLLTVDGALFFVSLMPLSYTILYVSERLGGGVWAAILIHAGGNGADALVPSLRGVGAYLETAFTFAIAVIVALRWHQDTPGPGSSSRP
jgi:uncharacterized protein